MINTIVKLSFDERPKGVDLLRHMIASLDNNLQISGYPYNIGRSKYLSPKMKINEHVQHLENPSAK